MYRAEREGECRKNEFHKLRKTPTLNLPPTLANMAAHISILLVTSVKRQHAREVASEESANCPKLCLHLFVHSRAVH